MIVVMSSVCPNRSTSRTLGLEVDDLNFEEEASERKRQDEVRSRSVWIDDKLFDTGD